MKQRNEIAAINGFNRRRRILLSAYACEPGQGSEPSVGWNVAMGLSKRFDVWVLVRSCHRDGIEAYVKQHGLQNPRFVFYDGPRKDRGFRPGLHVQLHYYVWQIGAFFVARRLHSEIGFDLVHHVTYVRYWSPSLLCLLPAPFVWGPVGGGENGPPRLRRGLGVRGYVSECMRDVVRRVAEFDPLVRVAARRSVVSIATTKETATRLRSLGASVVETRAACGLTQAEVERLAAIPSPPDAPFRFVSIGRLLHWKGVHLGLEAFRRAAPAGSEYWVIGDGPYRPRLERLASDLGISGQIRFWGALSRNDVLQRLQDCHVLVHPSLHDSGGFVCLEALAAGRAVICLDAGGPGAIVTEACGFAIPAGTQPAVIEGLAGAMTALAKNSALRDSMGRAGRDRIQMEYAWPHLISYFENVYERHAS